MKSISVKFWMNASLISLAAVAFLGVIMRYKIAFSLPLLDQDHLHHAHSHFAFTGWISQTLYLYIIHYILKSTAGIKEGKYKIFLAVNLITSWLMMFAFTVQGYKLFSIILSTVSIFLSFLFTIWFIADTKKIKDTTRKWMSAALLFNFISTAGTATLVYMLVTKTLEQHLYLASVYWYLHFQYNGWFFFVCMGLLLAAAGVTNDKFPFYGFLITCIPSYFLSVLWINLTLVQLIIIALAAFIQLVAWIDLCRKVYSSPSVKAFSFAERLTLLFLITAASVKFLLQAGSVHPELSKLAFGFRPVVIAYLHLVLLAFISVYLVFHCIKYQYINYSNSFKNALLIFLSGILLNELLLALQGITSFAYITIPGIQVMLLIATVFILSGSVMMAAAALKKYDVRQL